MPSPEKIKKKIKKEEWSNGIPSILGWAFEIIDSESEISDPRTLNERKRQLAWALKYDWPSELSIWA